MLQSGPALKVRGKKELINQKEQQKDRYAQQQNFLPVLQLIESAFVAESLQVQE